MKVLIVNHSEQTCGVWQFGKRFSDLASRSTKIEYIYREVLDFGTFANTVNELQPNMIIYNWYPVTMKWLPESFVRDTKYFKHFFNWHDGFVRQHYDGYIFSGAGEKDPDARRIYEEKSFIIPRPLFDYDGVYSKNSIPHIGSFGLSGWHKGFPDLVTMVNETFDDAVLNIHMPFAFFGDAQGVEGQKIAAMCRELNTNPNVQLNITHHLMSTKELLNFLVKNDINAFLYQAQSEGLSSVLDYALSVKKPIAITNSMMFRHIVNDEIVVGKDNSLVDIMNRGTKPVEKYYKMWSTERFVKELDNVVESNIN